MPTEYHRDSQPEVISHFDRYPLRYREKTGRLFLCGRCHEPLFEGDEVRYTVLTVPGTNNFEWFMRHADLCEINEDD
jgi:hypothetical protein